MLYLMNFCTSKLYKIKTDIQILEKFKISYSNKIYVNIHEETTLNTSKGKKQYNRRQVGISDIMRSFYFTTIDYGKNKETELLSISIWNNSECFDFYIGKDEILQVGIGHEPLIV